MEYIANVINILFLNKLSPEIAGLVLALGALTLFIFFFRTEEWKNLSEIDKLILSGLVGYILWFFLIIPIAFACHILNFYYKPNPYALEEIINFVSLFFILFSSFTVLYIQKKNNFNDFHAIIGYIKSAIKFLILFTPMIIFFFSFTFFFSIYKDKTVGIAGSFILIEIIWVFWFLLLGLINKDEFKNFDITLKTNDKKKVMFIIGLFVVSIIGGILVGSYYTNPSIRNSTNLDRIEITSLPVNREYGYLSTHFIYNTTYEIRFRSVKWVNIESNYTIIQAYDTDNKSKKYEQDGSSIYLRGSDKTNVVIFESKTQNISKSFGILSKKYFNTSQEWEWNITLINKNMVKTEVEALDFYNDENLRLIRYSSDDIDAGTLDSEINLTNPHFSVNDISIEPNETKSLNLYFTK